MVSLVRLTNCRVLVNREENATYRLGTLSNKAGLYLYSQSTQSLVEDSFTERLRVGEESPKEERAENLKGWGFVLSNVLLKLSYLLEELDIRSPEISEYE